MTIPPPDKQVGDPGHTEDHNLIAQVLIDHDARLQGAETILEDAITTVSPSDVNLDNSENPRHTYINLPSGDRSGQPDVFGVYRGGSRVTALDGNGYLRSRAVSASDVVRRTQAHANQSADLDQWLDSSGNIIARVDAQGKFHDGGNVSPTSPMSITLAGGLQWDSTAGSRPQYWQLGEYVELRGSIRTETGAAFDFSGSQVLLGSLPVDLGAPSGHRSIQPTQQTVNGFFCQVIVSPNGTVWAQGDPSHRPLWISLDGIRFRKV